MCIICDRTNLDGLTNVDISGCDRITSVDKLPSRLKTLYCDGCNGLTSLEIYHMD